MRIRWQAALLVLTGAAAASIFSTLLAYQAVRNAGQQPVLWRLATLNFTFWFGWVLLAIPLVYLSARLRIDRHPRIAVPLHLLAILAAAVVHVAIQTTADLWVVAALSSAAKTGTTAAAWWRTEWMLAFPLTLTRLIDWELIAGAAVIAIAHAGFYHSEVRQRALREAQLETRLVEAQLRMLQHQMHPHFLFNTLHAISALMHRDVAAADRMLAKLSDLLRITLDSVGRPEIRLHEEIEFLEKYLQIEQVRLGDRLTVTWRVDPNTLDAAIPALLLQPLVENAIKHGIAPLSGPGRITVGARVSGDKLLLTVTDTGPGPSDRDLTALSTGMGVANTRARLTHQFGPNYRFEFRRSADGFTVLVAIPYRPEPGETRTAFVA